MDERKQDMLALRMEKRKMMGKEDKRCERITSMRTIRGERRPNDRYDVRSRDCHAMDAHMSYGKLSNETSGGASNLIAQEYLVSMAQIMLLGKFACLIISGSLTRVWSEL